jgi:uncharacterized membrane protein
MAGSRQGIGAWKQPEYDYRVNLKAEPEIRHLNKKMDLSHAKTQRRKARHKIFKNEKL